MGRAPCCDKANVKRGPWSPEEDEKLKEYMEKNGAVGNWISLPQKAGLRRCGKSCRLRWLNYLRPNIKHGEFSDDEDRIICTLFSSIGSRWSIIATHLPGRTDNDIKNYWNTKLKKKLMGPNLSQRTSNHQSTTYPSSILRNPPSSSPYYNTSSTPSSPFKCGTHHSFIPSNLFNTHINQDGHLGHTQNYQEINKDSTFIMFGSSGDQASCSSSENGKEADYNYEKMGSFQSLKHKLVLSNGGNIDGFDEKPNGFCEETPLMDYSSLDEINELISTNLSNNHNFFSDENKAEEKVMYHYY